MPPNLKKRLHIEFYLPIAAKVIFLHYGHFFIWLIPTKISSVFVFVLYCILMKQMPPVELLNKHSPNSVVHVCVCTLAPCSAKESLLRLKTLHEFQVCTYVSILSQCFEAFVLTGNPDGPFRYIIDAITNSSPSAFLMNYFLTPLRSLIFLTQLWSLPLDQNSERALSVVSKREKLVCEKFCVSFSSSHLLVWKGK